MTVQAFIVNAFADDFARGNPAGVILYDTPLSEEKMQRIAFDINKSETAFVGRAPEANDYVIRWFSPSREVPLCGHATLASSRVLWEMKSFDAITFHYAAGSLKVQRRGEGFVMSFPLDEYQEIELDPLYQSFFPGIDLRACIYGKRTKKVALRVDDSLDLRTFEPNFDLMRKSIGIFSNGIAITRRSEEFDFESRYFNPWFGVDEDPVTGSVHTMLAHYWGDILDKDSMVAHQASPRPGELILMLHRDQSIVEIGGRAKIVMRGSMEV